MKANEMKAVFTALRFNLEAFKSSNGNAEIVGLEGFTPRMLDMFDAEFDKAVAQYLASN